MANITISGNGQIDKAIERGFAATPSLFQPAVELSVMSIMKVKE